MKLLMLISGVLLLLAIGCNRENKETNSDTEETYVHSSDPITAGRYLVVIGGCNDCHTNGYLQSEGNVPEEDWLTGSPIGWQGPWGTTYPSNLRLRVQEMTEEEWVETIHTRDGLPPMPWMNVKQLHEKDARALYSYIKSLGPKGDHMPAAVAPNQEPDTPYMSMIPLNMPENIQPE